VNAAGFDLHATLTQKLGVKAPLVNQVEFNLRLAKRGQEVRWWYWIDVDRDRTVVRLSFDGNVSANKDKMAEAMLHQAQSDEYQKGFYRFLRGTEFDPGAEISEAIDRIETGLTALLNKPAAPKPGGQPPSGGSGSKKPPPQPPPGAKKQPPSPPPASSSAKKQAQPQPRSKGAAKKQKPASASSGKKPNRK
jgi:hypothetical protein